MAFVQHFNKIIIDIHTGIQYYLYRTIVKPAYRRRKTMKSNSIKMRTFGCGQFHEFVLPNGKVLLIDPYWGFGKNPDGYYDDGLWGHDPDEITGADYIILTHTHLDHDKEVAYYTEKYDSLVISPAMSAESVLHFHNIGCDNLFLAFPYEELAFKDLTVKVFPAKHCNLGSRYNPDYDLSFERHGLAGHKGCDDWGSIESYDYLITTKDGFQILLANGRDIYTSTYLESQKICPDLLIRQAEVKYEEGPKKGQMYSAEDYAELCARFRATMAIPTHYDSVCKKYGGKEWLDNFYADVAAEYKKLVPGGFFFFPEVWKWYSIGLDISEE